MAGGKNRLQVLRRWLLMPLITAAALEGSACAVTNPQKQVIACSVQNADKLPPSLGGHDAICEAITRVAAPAAQRQGVQAVDIEVIVVSDTRLKAAASISGRRLPEQNIAISDRQLNMQAIEMLATAIATQLSNETL